jgi:hypothetical protein
MLLPIWFMRRTRYNLSSQLLIPKQNIRMAISHSMDTNETSTPIPPSADNNNEYEMTRDYY